MGGDEVDGPKALDTFPSNEHTITEYIYDDGKTNGNKKVLAPRADGLVREMKTQKVVSREEVQERTETEDVKHFGDFSDEVSSLQALSSFLSLVLIFGGKDSKFIMSTIY